MFFDTLSSGAHSTPAILIKDVSLLLVFCVILVQVKAWNEKRILRSWERRNRCGHCPTAPNKLPGGIEGFFILFRNLKELDFLEVFVRARDRTMGRYTYRLNSLASKNMITTNDPENIQAMLATQFHDFDLGIGRKKFFFDVIGNGIFTAEHDDWAHYRPMLKPQFSRVQIEDLESAGSHLDILLKALPDENKAGWIEKVDLMPFLYRFTMDVSTEFLFGESVNSQSKILHAEDSSNTSEIQTDMDFAEALSVAQDFIIWRVRVSIFWHFAIAKKRQFRNACNIIKTFTDRFVRLALASNYNTEEGKYFLLNELKNETQDPVELRDQVLHLLGAGRDTTSGLLSWAILLLARHPSEFRKAREAILNHFGTEQVPKGPMTFSSLKACKPLLYVLQESLRLFPLVSMNSREATKDTTLPVGGGPNGRQPIAVMKGDRVGWSAYVVHRRHDLWGEDADEFRPSRWRGRKMGWEFIAFSGGPRVCIGQQYALNEAAFVIARLLQRFDAIEALDMTGPLKKNLSVTLSPGNGVKVRMHKA